MSAHRDDSDPDPKQPDTTSGGRRTFLKTTALAGGALAVGSTASMRVLAAPPTVAVGQIAPLTGSAAEFGPFYRDAAHLAIKHVNEAAKQVFGGPIVSKITTEDTNTLPTPAIESARKLVNANNVSAIVGAWSSGVTVATATSVSIPNGVLQISNGSTSPLISVLPEDEGNDLLFRTTSPDTLQGVVDAQLAAGEIMDDYKHMTAATIFVNNPYGQGLSNAFAKSFQKRGGTVQAQVPHPEEVQPTYKSQLAVALKDDPDLLFCASYPGHTATFLKESRDTFDYTNWLFVDGNKSTKVVDAVGAEALAGKIGTAPGTDNSLAAYKNFEKAFSNDYDRSRVPPFTASAYDAGLTIGLAAARAIAKGESSLGGDVLNEHLRPVANPPGETITAADVDSIAKGMQSIKDGKDVDYAGASGATNFGDNGDVKTPVEIWKFTEDGKIETVQLQSPSQIPSE
jgi:ABC-type branched-subunit amino acid transport system substrate-binding protein